MNKDLLLQQFDLLATAPGGVAKLRELILTLAVQGKLVPQDPADEPATELLKRIRVEKERLIAEKKIRRSKPLEPIDVDEQMFELPRNWEWERLGNLGDWGAGATPPRSTSAYYGGRIPWFKSGELTADFISESEETVTEDALKNCSLRLNQVGDVLVAMYGATIGKTAILSVVGTTNQAVCACTPFSGLQNTYLLMLLKAIKPHLVSLGAGGAQPNISREKIISVVIGLPPLPEQTRIVARVEELMHACDALEAKGQQQAAHHRQLVETLLGTLTDPDSATPTQDAWQRVAAHFDTLLDRPSAVDALEQTILQLAVRGQLVAQDPTDEPASELLKRIRTEKDRLIAEGKIKRDKPLAPIGEDEQPFELPPGWAWVRFDELIHPQKPIAYGVLVPGPDVETGIPFVRIGDLSLNHPPEKPEKVISPEVDAQFQRTRLEGGEILMGVVGSIGKIGIAPTTWAGANIARAICRIVPADTGLHDFVLLLLQTKIMQDSFAGDTRTLAQPTLNIGLIRAAYTPMPPPAEQARIVSRVAHLRRLCADLRQRITQSQTTQAALAESFMNHDNG